MENKIVHSRRNEAFTSSKVVADMLEVGHSDLLRTVNKIVERIEKQPAGQHLVFPQKFIKTSFVNKMGRTYEMYDMNEQAYMKLAMHLKGYEKAEFVQDAIIEAFSIMKAALMNKDNASWIKARNEGKEVRAIEMDTVKDFVDYATTQGSSNAKFYYSNITKMTNKALELLVQVKDGKPLRDMATAQELGFISVLENRAIQSLKYGMDNNLPYKYIYELTKDSVNELAENLCFKPLSINK